MKTDQTKVFFRYDENGICDKYQINEYTLRSYLNGNSKNPTNIIFYNYKYLDNE